MVGNPGSPKPLLFKEELRGFEKLVFIPPQYHIVSGLDLIRDLSCKLSIVASIGVVT